jgi:hypothetical protein
VINLNIEQLRNELKVRIERINKRIERLSAPSFYDQTTKIENLHGEAMAYEKVLKMIEND